MPAKFKNKQKVICVKTPEYNPTIFSIKVNHIYKIEGDTGLLFEYISPIDECEKGIYYHLSYGEYDLVGLFHEDNFMTLKEYRKLKLQKIDESR